MKQIVWIFFAGLLLAGCGRFGKKATGDGKERIVCVSKQMTEFLFALHQGDKIVGIDLTSTYPSETKKLTTVGYHRHLNAEGIISLEPTVVIHQGDVAPPTVMPQLEKVGLNIKKYPAGSTLDSAKIVLRMVAHDYGVDTAAQRIIGEMDRSLAKADSIVKRYPNKPRVLIIHFGQQRNQYFVMGTRGTANSMLTMAGGINAADTSSFRDLSPEVIAREQPDVILATDFGFDRLGGSIEKFMELPGIALTPAARNRKIYRIEEHDLVYFGPRTGENIVKMATLIHQ
ncbi:MAG TPA: ABC transporter substrate-binding protein [Flavisolibacter sp.]|jgi:iron complex transport system substrate-binding protein|nr:ABC transporter substrate-binding protein [Flavisolibacter sp.]